MIRFVNSRLTSGPRFVFLLAFFSGLLVSSSILMVVIISKPDTSEVIPNDHNQQVRETRPDRTGDVSLAKLVALAESDPQSFLKRISTLPYLPELDQAVLDAVQMLDLPPVELARLLNGIGPGAWRVPAWEAAMRSLSDKVSARDAIDLVEQAAVNYRGTLYEIAFERTTADDVEWVMKDAVSKASDGPVLEWYLRHLVKNHPEQVVPAFDHIPAGAGNALIFKYHFLSDYIATSSNKGDALREAFHSVADSSGSLDWKANYAAAATQTGDSEALMALIDICRDLPPVQRTRILRSVPTRLYSHDEVIAMLSLIPSQKSREEILQSLEQPQR